MEVIVKNPPRAWHGLGPFSGMHPDETTRLQAMEPERSASSPNPTTDLGLSDPGQVTLLYVLLFPHLKVETIIPHSIGMKLQYKENSQHSV